MNRRKFMVTAGSTPVISSIGLNRANPSASIQDREGCRAAWLKQTDLRISGILESQQANQSLPFFGGFPDQHGIFHVGTAAWNVCRLVCGLISEDSKYFNDQAAFKALGRAIQFVKDRQHSDGTIDLVSTNFHSTPDTGFVVEPIALALACSRKTRIEAFQGFEKISTTFLEQAGKALRVGGIHTPNHRWVVCMALARINQLLPDRRLVARIDRWLQEKIDIDPDGQYTEKSTSVYSPLVNRCLITIARLLDRKQLFEPVRKNLSMSRYFIRANGEIVTEVSRRQDQYTTRKMGNYFYSYRYLAGHDQNKDFAAMAGRIQETVGVDQLSGTLPYLMEDPAVLAPIPLAARLPTDYKMTFPHSKVARIRRGEVDATVLAGNTAVFALHKEKVNLQATRIASAFFGKGQFSASSLEELGNGFRLIQNLQGPYYQPIAATRIPPDGNWESMPKSLRPQSEIQKLQTTVDISEVEGKFVVEIKIEGTDDVPVAIEFGFGHPRPTRKLIGVRTLDEGNHSFLVEKTVFGVEQDGEKIDLEIVSMKSGRGERKKFPSICQHQWTQLRGALPKLAGDSVYLTGYTPFEVNLKVS